MNTNIMLFIQTDSITCIIPLDFTTKARNTLHNFYADFCPHFQSAVVVVESLPIKSHIVFYEMFQKSASV